jgi:hypothetical protein
LLSFKPDKHSRFWQDIVDMSRKTVADFPFQDKEATGSTWGPFAFAFQDNVTVLASSANPTKTAVPVVHSTAEWQTMWRLVQLGAVQVSDSFWSHTLMLAVDSLGRPGGPKFDLETVLTRAREKGRQWPVYQLKTALVHVLRRFENEDNSDHTLVQALLIPASPKDRRELATFALVTSAALDRTWMVDLLSAPVPYYDDEYDMFDHPCLVDARPSLKDADNAAVAAAVWLPR